MLREGREKMRPLLLKVGVALAITFAGYVFSHLRRKRIQSCPPLFPGESISAVGGPAVKEIQSPMTPEREETPRKSNDDSMLALFPSIKTSESDENLLLPEFNDLVQKEFDTTGNLLATRDVLADTPRSKPPGDPVDPEVISLGSVVKLLGEKERKLEMQLLEYYGLREQENAVRELENRLKINTMEAKLFTLKIESLQAENRRLEAQVSDQSQILAELESARTKIKQLKRKIKSDGEQSRDQLTVLQQRVVALQDELHRAASYEAEVLKKSQRLKDLEAELSELKKTCSNLQCENSELAKKLESTQILASSGVDGPEVQALEEEAKQSRDANAELEKQLERLQTDRCADAEELVYLRWVNACFRYELRNFKPPPGKTTARDLSKNLSPKSEQKAKELILEYASSGGDDDGSKLVDLDSGYCSSSLASTLTDAGDCDDSSFDLSTNRSSSSSKLKFFSKLKKLVSGKHGHNHHSKERVLFTSRTDSSCGGSRRQRPDSITSLEEPIGRNSYDSSSSWTFVRSRSKSLGNLLLLEKAMEEKTDDSSHSTISTPRWYSDTHRSPKPSREESRELRKGERHLDSESQRRHRRVVQREHGVTEFDDHHQVDQHHNTAEKLELKKYALVLKSSRMG